ncbi:MAG: PfkB family carbohydrate kinase, partial [Actinobacteria bacterium]|nr:PfkB family carbohydrate kinase [Actinomycetota bacterium]
KGSLISNNKDILEIPAVKEKIKVDTTGAGDVYCTAFLSEYLRTEDLYKSGLFASAAATILIEKTGGVSISRIPVEKKVREKIESFN